MFWRSVVGKLAITILLLVSFVLFILTILLLEFFENFHMQEAEKALMQTANKVSIIMEQHHDNIDLMLETTERVKDPSSRVVIVFPNGTLLTSETTNDVLTELKNSWFINNQDVDAVRENNQTFNKQMMLPDQDVEVMMVGAPKIGRASCRERGERAVGAVERQ